MAFSIPRLTCRLTVTHSKGMSGLITPAVQSCRSFSHSQGLYSSGSTKWRTAAVPGSPHLTAFFPPDLDSTPPAPSNGDNGSKDPTTKETCIISLLDSNPPTRSLSLGISSTNPPTPGTFKTNPKFMPVVHEALIKHVADDQGMKAEAANVVASIMGNVGAVMTNRRGGRRDTGKENRGGGWVHLADARNPAEWARVPDADDIIASIEVDNKGQIHVGEDGKGYQKNEMYRLVTPEGILKLSPFLHDKVVAHLKKVESQGLD